MSIEQNKQHAFNAYCRRIVKNEAINIQLEYDRQSQREVSFSELSQRELQSLRDLQHVDRYVPDRQIFDVLSIPVEVEDSGLAWALSTLTVEQRNIVLLFYFVDMKDGEIAKRLQLKRSTVQYQRTSILEELRKRLEGYEHE